MLDYQYEDKDGSLKTKTFKDIKFEGFVFVLTVMLVALLTLLIFH